MTYTVNEEQKGLRLDAYISAVSELSRSAAAKLIEDGAVLVNQKSQPKKYAVNLIL